MPHTLTLNLDDMSIAHDVDVTLTHHYAIDDGRNLTLSLRLNIDDLLAEIDQIALIWCVDDVQSIRPDLSRDQAFDVLLHAQRHHDCCLGLSWDSLKDAADHLFGDAPNEEESD